MTTSYMTKISAFVLILTMGILGTTMAASDKGHPLEEVLEDLANHIGELTLNIDKLSKEMEFLRSRTPNSKDPLIQDILDLDLKGWEIHQEQWNMELEHLQFTEGLLQKALAHPEEKPQLLQTWLIHKDKYLANLQVYREQRTSIEKQRKQTGAQLVEQYLR